MTRLQQPHRLRRYGFVLEGITLGWNVVGVIVLAIAAAAARSAALIGFGLDSLIEIGASAVVIWELSDVHGRRRERAVSLIGVAFTTLAVYLAAQTTWVLVAGHRAHHSALGITWTAVTAAVMFGLAQGKKAVGEALGNPVLVTEGRVTLVDAMLAAAVLIGLVFNAALDWWWADAASAYVIVFYAGREAHEALALD